MSERVSRVDRVARFALSLLLLAVASSVFSEGSGAEGDGHQMDHGMTMDETGMVMNANSDTLPDDCQQISRDYEFTVTAGTEYAEPYADTVFGYDQHEWSVEPCSRITVTFQNEDKVRHQWMLHRLPKYLYDHGMFHMEAAGGETQVGTFIVPSDDRTYLVHCDIAQHMEKGMKGQLVVGRGSGDLWSIPGVTAKFERRAVEALFPRWVLIGMLVLGFVVTAYLWPGRAKGSRSSSSST